MVNGAGTLTDGTPYILIGLTGDDWDLIRSGMPFTINLPADMPEHNQLPTLQVVFLGGADEGVIHEELKAMGWTRDR